MKLIKQISSRYILVSVTVALLCVPILFIVLKRVLLNNLDELILQQKEWIVKKLHTTSPGNFISFNNNIIITMSDRAPARDSLFYEDIYMPEDSETITHRVLLTGAKIHGKPYRIQIQRSIIETEDLVKTVVWVMTLFLLVLVTGLLLVNWSLAKKIWRPFYETIEKLRDYKIDKTPVLRLGRSNISEFNEMNQTLENLADKNQQIFLAQKEFTENAAHELQTPLAIIKTNVDMLLQKESLTGEEAAIIGNISEASQRMARLNKSLLLLSKIENRQFTQNEMVNFTILIRKYLEQYEDAIHQKNIITETRTDGDFIVNVDPVLASILTGNLLSNAIRHNIPSGRIIIHTFKEKIVIANSGKEYELDNSRLFRRFQKQSHNNDSTGLGLEICKTICELSGMKLVYEFSEMMHTFILSKGDKSGL